MAAHSFIFDLDGTLTDTTYQRALAWKEALDGEGLHLSTWRIHRKMGMSGGLLVRQLALETGAEISPERIERIREAHSQAFKRFAPTPPLPGAAALLQFLSKNAIPWAIATSGALTEVAGTLGELHIDIAKCVVVTRDQVARAKPDPSLFIEAAKRLGQPIEHANIVGDSIWDMYGAARARGLGIGLLSGGYSSAELKAAGAYRIFDDPADLLAHIDELVFLD